MSETTTAPVELEVGFASGTSVPRKEDGRLVQGQGVFADDVKRHGMGYVHFVRAPYAHARIVSVDVSAAEALEGVYGTLTPDEVVELTDPFFELTTPPGSQIKDYALAVGRVRHIGEPVVAVVAASRELARDATDLVEVEYEPLDVLVDARRAQDDGAPILHEDAGTNVVWSGTFDWGDVDGALKAADRVVKIKELHFDRFSSTPLECSAALVEYDRGTGQFTLHCNHQMPGVAAIWMGPALRVPLDKLRFVTQDIGGGFGNKITTHTYLTACCLLARKLKRPIQWTEWRTDQHTANAHGNERWFHDIEVEDNVTAYFEFPNGATGTFVSSTGEAPGANRFEIVGTRGRLVLERDKLRFTRNETDMLEFSKAAKLGFARPEVWHVEIPFENAANGHAVLMQNFVNAILDGEPLIAPGAEGIHSVELANVILFSSLEDRTIELPMDSAAYEARLNQLIADSKLVKKVVEVSNEDFAKSFVR